MGNPKGVKRDFKQLEQRRLEAARQLSQGLSPSEVARQLGVHRQSVSRWQQTLQEEGRQGLKQAGRAGRKPRLSAADLRRIELGLRKGPQALGYSTQLWTARRVRELIRQQCGVSFTVRHAWWILRRLRWTCQRPRGRALERDEEAIRRWKKERWPTLKKTPFGAAKRSSSSTRAG